MKEWLKGKPKDAPPPKEVSTLRVEAAGLYVLRLTGVVDKAMVDRIQEVAIMGFERGVDSVRLLVGLKGFQGWKREDGWDDINFFAQYEQRISRIAVIGDPRWETEMMMFLAAGRRSGEVRYFGPGEEQKARDWLAG